MDQAECTEPVGKQVVNVNGEQKNQTLSGLGWTSFGNVMRQVIQIITLVVLSRLLSPADFGIYAILMIFIQFLNVLGAMGTAQVVIHFDNVDGDFLSSIFMFNVILNIGIYIVLLIVSPYIALYFEQLSLQHLLNIIGLTFVIASLGFVQKALLEKTFQFRKVVIIELVSMISASILGIYLAIKGFGVISLVFQSISYISMMSLLLWQLSNWKPRFYFSLKHVLIIWKYSVNLSMFSIINFFSRNADNFLIGKYIGPAGLGVYNIGYKIMLLPIDAISQIVIRVMFPVFSTIKSDNVAFKKVYSETLIYISLITFPIVIGGMAISGNLVKVLFASSFYELHDLILIFGPIGIMQSLGTTIGAVFTAKGTTDMMFRVGTVASIVNVLSFLIGLPFGVKGVAIAYAISNAILMYPCMQYSLKQIDFTFFEMINLVYVRLICAVVMGVIVYSAGLFSLELTGSLMFSLVFQILLGVTIYILLVRITSPDLYRSVVDTVVTRYYPRYRNV